MKPLIKCHNCNKKAVSVCLKCNNGFNFCGYHYSQHTYRFCQKPTFFNAIEMCDNVTLFKKIIEENLTDEWKKKLEDKKSSYIFLIPDDTALLSYFSENNDNFDNLSKDDKEKFILRHVFINDDDSTKEMEKLKTELKKKKKKVKDI